MVGIPPWRLWASTRSEVLCAMRAARSKGRQEQDLAVFVAWRTATLSRAKKIPALARLLRTRKRMSTAEQDKVRAAMAEAEAEWARIDAAAATRERA